MPGVKSKVFQFVRIVTSVALLGIGTLILIGAMRNVVPQFDRGWDVVVFGVSFNFLFSGIFLGSGYFLLRQRYRSVASIWMMLTAAAVFCFILGVPTTVQEHLKLANTDNSMGILRLVSVILAICATRWFFNFTYRWLDRLLPREPEDRILECPSSLAR